jgi:hypothetical protein
MMDSKIEKAKSLVMLALKSIETALDNNEIDNIPRDHIIECKENLQRILTELEQQNVTLKNMRKETMAHIIVDSWPYNSISYTLGDKIIAAERSYLEL